MRNVAAMQNSKTDVFEGALERAKERYRVATPSLDALHATLARAGALDDSDAWTDDHVAFRTFGVPGLGIASLERLLGSAGYSRREDFRFERKRLDATWFAPPRDGLPRVFVSEARVADLSARARTIIASYADAAAREAARSYDPRDRESVDALLRATPWPRPTYDAYRTLLEESEYAAWVLAFGYTLNHQTFSVHAFVRGFATLEPVVELLRRGGHRLAESGGAIKTSDDGLLHQTSTLADDVAYRFACGRTELVAGSYVEFAQRDVLPAYRDLPAASVRREHRRDGFETQNADRIFESTDR